MIKSDSVAVVVVARSSGGLMGGGADGSGEFGTIYA